MRTKPQSFVRNWQWNNNWYLQQERRVFNIGMKEALTGRSVPVHRAEDLLTPAHPLMARCEVEPNETVLEAPARDHTHPLWQETPAFQYSSRSWLPRGLELEAALGLTHSVAVSRQLEPGAAGGRQLEGLEGAVRAAYTGDAVQRLLPKNWKVPYIGWHPVESKMRPRNQYNWKEFSWGRNMPREYGVPLPRQLTTLTRGLVTASMDSCPGLQDRLLCKPEPSVLRQVVRSAGGELLRLNIEVLVSTFGRHPVPEVAGPDQVAATRRQALASVAPLSPLSSCHPTNIYRPGCSHPVTSLQHSHPYTNTVFDLNTAPIGDPFTDDRVWHTAKQRSRCLMFGYTAALGQARLLYGEGVRGELPRPVTVNAVSTNGVWWELATFQLNTMDPESEVKNIFFHRPESLKLMDFCGYRSGRPELTGLRPETFLLLHGLLAGSSQ